MRQRWLYSAVVDTIRIAAPTGGTSWRPFTDRRESGSNVDQIAPPICKRLVKTWRRVDCVSLSPLCVSVTQNTLKAIAVLGELLKMSW